MYLREIEYALALYKHGNISRAAEELHISQPTLSGFLKNLEAEIGTTLFERDTAKLRITWAGMRYMDYATQIHAIQDNWKRELKDILQEKKGKMTIAVSPDHSIVLTKALQIFYKTFPQVPVSVINVSEQIEFFTAENEDVDFAIYAAADLHPDLQYDYLGETEIVLLAPRGYINDHYGLENTDSHTIHLQLLAQEWFVLNPPAHSVGNISRTLFQQTGISPRIRLETAGLALPIELVKSHLALCFAPASYYFTLEDLQEQLQAYSVGEEKPMISVYAVYRKGRTLTSYESFFFQTLQEIYANLGESP